MSDETFDYICTNCSEENLTKEAIKYCVECQRYFCQECITAHKRILKGHTLLDNTAGPSPGQHSSLPSFPTEQCSIHKGKILDMYCGNHKVVCCYVCVAMDHKSCKDLHSITDDIDQLYKKSDTDQTKHDLARILKTIDIRQTNTQTLLQQLRDAKTSAVQAVKEYRSEIDKYLDNLEDASIKEIEREYRKMESELLEERKMHDKFIDELKKLDDLLTKSEKNTPQLFVCTNLAQQKIMSKQHEEITTRKSSVQVSFIPCAELSQLVRELTSLGKSFINTIPTKDALYKATLIKTVNIKLENDAKDSSVYGSCIVDDTVLFTDYNNKKLKRAKVSSLTIVDSCQLNDYPNCVCRVGTQEVAVACKTIIQFVSIHGKLVLSRHQKMNHKCYGIDYKNDNLYITDEGKSLYMYDMSGNLLKTITHDTHGQPLFQYSNHIVFGDSGCRWFVGGDDVGLVCFDENCEYVMTIDDKFARADGVCVDGRGNVIVASRKSSIVSQFSEDGEKRGVVVSSANCLRYPRSVCFHQGLNRLFVTNGSNQVNVYQLC